MGDLITDYPLIIHVATGSDSLISWRLDQLIRVFFGGQLYECQA
jgi:hypothetical protein